MLDCNSLTLALTDLQLWVLGQDLISDMCVFQTLGVLNQWVHVEIDAVHLWYCIIK